MEDIQTSNLISISEQSGISGNMSKFFEGMNILLNDLDEEKQNMASTGQTSINFEQYYKNAIESYTG